MTEQTLPRRVRVIEPRCSVDADPVRLHTGDTVGVGHRDQLRTDYLWTTDVRGRSSWVPQECLDVAADGRQATALRDYDSTEITIGRGETLDVLDELGGWYLCRSASGLIGWVPHTSVEALNDEPPC